MTDANKGTSPLGWNILVEMEAVEETTESGIIVASKTEQKRKQGGHYAGRVVSLGPLIYLGYSYFNMDQTAAERAAMWGYAVGDLISFSRYSGKLYEDREGCEDLRYVRDTDVIAKLEDNSDG